MHQRRLCTAEDKRLRGFGTTTSSQGPGSHRTNRARESQAQSLATGMNPSWAPNRRHLHPGCANHLDLDQSAWCHVLATWCNARHKLRASHPPNTKNANTNKNFGNRFETVRYPQRAVEQLET
eukprot:787527-Pyramimonas_sp.AAC.1